MAGASVLTTPRRAGSRMVVVSNANTRPGSPTAMNITCHDRTSPMSGSTTTGNASNCWTTLPPRMFASPTPMKGAAEKMPSASGKRARSKVSDIIDTAAGVSVASPIPTHMRAKNSSP